MTTDIDPRALAERAARLEGWDQPTNYIWRSPTPTRRRLQHNPPTLEESFRPRLLWLVKYADAIPFFNRGMKDWEVSYISQDKRVTLRHPDPDIAVSLAFCAVVEAARAA